MDICSCFKEDSLSRLLGSPNNLLGIEYCKAIFRCRSTIRPVTIQRKGQGYHDKTLESGQASASAIRKAFLHLSRKKSPVSRRLCFLGSLPFLYRPTFLPILPLYSQGRILGPEDCAGLLNYRLLSPVP